jgi:YidC/Oxa1 family membrane protein insertase
MWTLIIVQPIFNLLVLILAIIPGHNFGLAVIIFTAIIRLLLWPLVKKQLHQTKVMRKLQPRIKEIKAKTKGNRQELSRLTMELYKEEGVSPFGSIGVLILQIPILIGLYEGINKVISDPHQLVDFAYPLLQHLPWMHQLSANIHIFDETLFGVVDLTKSAFGSGAIYWPALILVAASAIIQYYQSKQLMPSQKEGRSLRSILRDTKTGKSADQAEVSAAVGRGTQYFIPLLVFIFVVNLPSALALYFLVTGIVAYLQQAYILRQDEDEMSKVKITKKTLKEEKDTSTDDKSQKEVSQKASASDIIESGVVETKATQAKRRKSKSGKRKRRKK